jgi:hypothetical protein
VDIDPGAHRVIRRVSYNAADGVAQDGSALRVTSDDGPSTARLDPLTGVLSHKVRLSDAFIADANADVAAVGPAVWVSSLDEGTVYRLPSS